VPEGGAGRDTELAEAELAEAELVRRSWRSAELVESAQAAAELWWRRSWRRRSYGGGGAVAEAELAATPTELAEAEAGAGGSGAAGAGGGGAGDRTTDYGAGRSGTARLLLGCCSTTLSEGESATASSSSAPESAQTKHVSLSEMRTNMRCGLSRGRLSARGSRVGFF
jgi:hypothetical protein